MSDFDLAKAALALFLYVIFYWLVRHAATAGRDV